jgi:hypothetical protein
MAKNNAEPKLSKIAVDSKLKLLPKYTITPQLPKNDSLLQYLKEYAKNDRR